MSELGIRAQTLALLSETASPARRLQARAVALRISLSHWTEPHLRTRKLAWLHGLGEATEPLSL